MEPRFFQQQTQKLILSPQIRQYLKLLELPLAELEQAIETEIGENPFLEEKNSAPPIGTPGDSEKKMHGAEELHMGNDFRRLNDIDENYRSNFETLDLSRQDPKNLQERKDFQEGLLTKTEALSDFILWQTRLLDFTEIERKIAEEIIGNLNDDGYFISDLVEISQICKTQLSTAEKVLREIQTLDPPGIAARNLRETLSIQLKKKETELISRTPEEAGQTDLEEIRLAIRIVADQLPLLEKRDWPALARALGTPLELIKKAATRIVALEPKPGRGFYADSPLGAPPDASVSFNEDDVDSKNLFKIEIHNESLREIHLSPYYRRLLRNKNMDAKTRVFLKEKMQAAMNFLQALGLRQSTLRAITEEIVKAQPEFLEKGFAFLKPLRLKDISSTLGIHESTVSRAIHGKSILTPQGMIPYKSFFSNKLETAGGSESQKSLLQKIRHMIAEESPDKPLSDQEIVRQLELQGIKIARRTAAKYRDLLKILPTHLRRKK